MKKILAVISMLLLMLSLLCGCIGNTAVGSTTGSSPADTHPVATTGSESETTADTTSSAQENSTTGLQVGFGRADITPKESIILGGYFNPENRRSNNVLDPLYATCIALTDGTGNTVLLFHLDLLNTSSEKIPFVRKAVSKAVDVPAANIMLCATHTHSAPDIRLADNPIIEEYIDFMEAQMILAAQEALADCKTARMYTASTTVRNMNFVRHYRMDDGSVVGDNFGDPDGKTYVKHIQDADNELQLICFKREGYKDIVMVNWQVHPLMTGGSTKGDISADIVGSMRMALEPMLDCHMAYFTGGSGDLDPVSRIGRENIVSNYIQYGKTMAQKACHALEQMVEQETANLQILRRDTVLTADSGNTKKEIRSYGISFGDVALVTAPYEMFDSNGKTIKEESPFEMTFIATCTNGGNGYIPAQWAYEYGGYEVEFANYDEGAAEKMVEVYLELLNELYLIRK